MVPKLCLDTNILVDYLDSRPFELEAIKEIFKMTEQNQVLLYLSESIICTALYVSKSPHKLISAEMILKIATVLPSTNSTISAALTSPFKDKEDAILYYLAVAHKMNAFITRNVKDFAPFALPQTVVLTPAETIVHYHL